MYYLHCNIYLFTLFNLFYIYSPNRGSKRWTPDPEYAQIYSTGPVLYPDEYLANLPQIPYNSNQYFSKCIFLTMENS